MQGQGRGPQLNVLWEQQLHLLAFVGDAGGLEAALENHPHLLTARFDFASIVLITQKEMTLRSVGKWNPPPVSDTTGTMNLVREGINRFLKTGDVSNLKLEQRWCLQEFWKESTLLHYAALGDQKDCVKMLLAKGAVASVVNKSNLTPGKCTTIGRIRDILLKKTMEEQEREKKENFVRDAAALAESEAGSRGSFRGGAQQVNFAANLTDSRGRSSSTTEAAQIKPILKNKSDSQQQQQQQSQGGCEKGNLRRRFGSAFFNDLSSIGRQFQEAAAEGAIPNALTAVRLANNIKQVRHAAITETEAGGAGGAGEDDDPPPPPDDDPSPSDVGGGGAYSERAPVSGKPKRASAPLNRNQCSRCGVKRNNQFTTSYNAKKGFGDQFDQKDQFLWELPHELGGVMVCLREQHCKQRRVAKERKESKRRGAGAGGRSGEGERPASPGLGLLYVPQTQPLPPPGPVTGLVLGHGLGLSPASDSVLPVVQQQVGMSWESPNPPHGSTHPAAPAFSPSLPPGGPSSQVHLQAGLAEAEAAAAQPYVPASPAPLPSPPPLGSSAASRAGSGSGVPNTTPAITTATAPAAAAAAAPVTAPATAPAQKQGRQDGDQSTTAAAVAQGSLTLQPQTISRQGQGEEEEEDEGEGEAWEIKEKTGVSSLGEAGAALLPGGKTMQLLREAEATRKKAEEERAEQREKEAEELAKERAKFKQLGKFAKLLRPLSSLPVEQLEKEIARIHAESVAAQGGLEKLKLDRFEGILLGLLEGRGPRGPLEYPKQEALRQLHGQMVARKVEIAKLLERGVKASEAQAQAQAVQRSDSQTGGTPTPLTNAEVLWRRAARSIHSQGEADDPSLMLLRADAAEQGIRMLLEAYSDYAWKDVKDWEGLQTPGLGSGYNQQSGDSDSSPQRGRGRHSIVTPDHSFLASYGGGDDLGHVQDMLLLYTGKLWGLPGDRPQSGPGSGPGAGAGAGSSDKARKRSTIGARTPPPPPGAAADLSSPKRAWHGGGVGRINLFGLN